MRLCTNCAAKERKENAGRQDSPGLWSFPMPRMSRCPTCKAQAHGFEMCPACAVEKNRCQGCWTTITSSEVLLAEIAEHRQTLAMTRQAAEELYAQTIEPFKDEAAKFEAGIAASEAQRNSDCEPFWEAERLANEKWNRLPDQASDTDRIEASTAYFAAKTASENNSRDQFENERQRNRALRAEFAQYEQHYKAVKLRDRTLERAAATFDAVVERSIDIANAEATRHVAIEKANARYTRSLEMQDALDRMLSVI